MSTFIWLLFLGFGWLYWRLNRRITNLERLLETASAAQDTPAAVAEDTGDTVLEPAGEVGVALEDAEGSIAPEAPKAFVFKAQYGAQLLSWFRENWVLVVAAASLVLAGVFMVQYSVEQGLLTPFWRIVGAVAIGGGLIFGGQYLRRMDQTGNGDAANNMRHLSSTLSGAGVVVLYVAMMSAYGLYGLIGPTTALAALIGVSIIALFLGWFSGPVLAAIGIVGASISPFLVGGSSDAAWLVHYYLAFVGLTALGIDSLRRWAWISVLGLVAAFAGNAVLYWSQGQAEQHFLAAIVLLTLGSFIIPERRLSLRHGGPALLDAVLSRGKRRPDFPARLSIGSLVVACVSAFVVAANAPTSAVVSLSIGTFVVLLVLMLLWTKTAPALYDHALVPSIGLLAVICHEGMTAGPLYTQVHGLWSKLDNGAVGPNMPLTLWVLVGFAVLGSMLMFVRMQWVLEAEEQATTTPEPANFNQASYWAICAAVFAPAIMFSLELAWAPSDVVGRYPWAFAVIAVAGLLVLFARRAVVGDPRDGGQQLRVGLFAVGALALISLAIFLILTKSALTIALAVLVFGVALLDRRSPLPLLTWFIHVAVGIISFRLIASPGIEWALTFDDVSYLEVAFVFGATIALLIAARRILTTDRHKTFVTLESSTWTLSGIFIMLSLIHMFEAMDASRVHGGLGVAMAVWAALAMIQIYRLQGCGRFEMFVRGLLAVCYSLSALLMLAALLLELALDGYVGGLPVFDTLVLAFLMPALVFAVGAWKLRHIGKWRAWLATISALLSAVYIGLEIRRLWRGPRLDVPGFSDPELYSYTLAMVIAAAIMLGLAFMRRMDGLRRLAMIGVALTIMKVFFIDASGLEGLLRVVSFMGLGLSLVALTWLNRKMAAKW